MRFAVVQRWRAWRPARSTRWLFAIGAFVAIVAVLLWDTAAVVQPAAPPTADTPLIEAPFALAGAPSVDTEANVAATAPVGGSGLERVEVCGVGWVEAEPDGSIDMAAVFATPLVQQARGQVLDALRRTDDFTRATAIALELAGPGEGSSSLLMAETTCAVGACDATPRDLARASELYDELVRAATATPDPRVYSLVVQVCQWRRDAGSCGLLNPAQWAHVDPGNGMPWLDLLARAGARQDAAAIDDALYQIGAAARIDARPLAAAAAVAQVGATSSVASLVKERLAEISTGFSGPLGLNGYMEFSRACAARNFVDANRRELCERAATALAERSDSMISMRIGSAVGRRLGWPDARFDNVDALSEASQDVNSAVQPTFDAKRPGAALRGPLECPAIEKMLRHLEEVGTTGERDTARRWLERTGRFAEYRQRGAEVRARLVAREAAEAASRASR